MPVRIRRVVPAIVPAAVAAAALVIVGFLYVTSPASSDSTLVGRLTAGESGRAATALAGMIGLIWGASSLVAGFFQRRELVEIDGVARAMGMRRVADPSELTDAGLDLPVLRRQMSAVIAGTYESAEVVVGCFPLSARALVPVETPDSESGHSSAVACFRLPRELPTFALAPRGLTDRLASLLGSAEIAVDDHPMFSSAYRLGSTDEAATRALFSDTGLIARLVRDGGWYAECNGHWLALYRFTEPIPRATLPRFVQRASGIFRAFLGR